MKRGRKSFQRFEELDPEERAERVGFRWHVRRGDVVLAVCPTEAAALEMHVRFNPGTVVAPARRSSA